MENVDGNLAALAVYEKHIEKEEVRYDSFVAATMELIYEPYQEIVGMYNEMAEKHGYDTLNFEEFIAHNM